MNQKRLDYVMIVFTTDLMQIGMCWMLKSNVLLWTIKILLIYKDILLNHTVRLSHLNEAMRIYSM